MDESRQWILHKGVFLLQDLPESPVRFWALQVACFLRRCDSRPGCNTRGSCPAYWWRST